MKHSLVHLSLQAPVSPVTFKILPAGARPPSSPMRSVTEVDAVSGSGASRGGSRPVSNTKAAAIAEADLEQQSMECYCTFFKVHSHFLSFDAALFCLF